ncbi:MAG TPA: hypothetical protein PLN34_09810 [Alloprevotella sp.]|nr:hypothetical protein [Alloprevotella sp.]
MARVISKESVKRGNAAMIHGVKRGVSVDGRNVSVRCRTVTGVCTMTFSRAKIVKEAGKAFAKVLSLRHPQPTVN